MMGEYMHTHTYIFWFASVEFVKLFNVFSCCSSAYQEGYQSKDSCSGQDGGLKQDFWETFGSNSALSSTSVQKNTNADGWESWDNDWEKSTKKNPSKPAEETWDNSGW